MAWRWSSLLLISDAGLPDSRFESRWAQVRLAICEKLLNGGRPVVHCCVGFGRAGTVAVRILVDIGTPPREAITRVRAARADTIEVAQPSLARRVRWASAGRDRVYSRELAQLS
jgi:protein-tyrosine phosphatase